MNKISNARIAVLGLGYVGLPLAVEFGKSYPTVGFDIDLSRIEALRAGKDSTLEVSADELAGAQGLTLTSDLAAIGDCNTYIVTVPTPIDEHKRPDMRALLAASHTIS